MVDTGELRSFLISFGRVFAFFQCVHSIPCVNKSGKITNTVLLKNYFYSSLTVISSWNYYAAKHEGTLDRSRRSTTNNFLFFLNSYTVRAWRRNLTRCFSISRNATEEHGPRLRLLGTTRTIWIPVPEVFFFCFFFSFPNYI